MLITHESENISNSKDNKIKGILPIEYNDLNNIYKDYDNRITKDGV